MIPLKSYVKTSTRVCSHLKIIDSNWDNEEDAIKTLMNIYGTLGDNEGIKEMKATSLGIKLGFRNNQ